MQMEAYSFSSFEDSPKGQSLEISAFAKYQYFSFLYSLMQMKTPRITEKITDSLAYVVNYKI